MIYLSVPRIRVIISLQLSMCRVIKTGWVLFQFLPVSGNLAQKIKNSVRVQRLAGIKNIQMNLYSSLTGFNFEIRVSQWWIKQNFVLLKIYIQISSHLSSFFNYKIIRLDFYYSKKMDYEIRGLIWQEWIKNLDNFVSIFNFSISINNISSIFESPLREFWGKKHPPVWRSLYSHVIEYQGLVTRLALLPSLGEREHRVTHWDLE